MISSVLAKWRRDWGNRSLAKDSRGLVLAPDLHLASYVTLGMSIPNIIIPWASVSPFVT